MVNGINSVPDEKTVTTELGAQTKDLNTSCESTNACKLPPIGGNFVVIEERIWLRQIYVPY